MADPLNTLIAGIFLTLAGFSGLVRHFFLEPTTPGYPQAPPFLLGVFFLFSSVLVVLGLRYLSVLGVYGFVTEQTIPPGASPVMALLSANILMYKLSLLYNVLRQHYPAEVWLRMDRISNTVKKSCPRR
jgi:hypothetical protein